MSSDTENIIEAFAGIIAIAVPVASPYIALLSQLKGIASKVANGEDLSDEDLEAISEARDLNVQALEDAVENMPDDDQPEVDSRDPDND